MGVKYNARSFAIKCLVWQHQQLQRSPLDGVMAAPLEHNIFEWHGNFYFKEDHEHFPGMIVHFILSLPHDYPNGIPDMRLLTEFPHSHVFGDTICFSLLSQFQWYFQASDLPATAYWNPARSIRSLLESVYIFLINDEDRHISICKRSAQRASQNALRACCSGCGHNGKDGKIWPPEELWMSSSQSNGTTTALGPSKQQQQDDERVCALAMHQHIAAALEPTPTMTTTTTVSHKPRLSSLLLPPKKAVVVDLAQAMKKDHVSAIAKTNDDIVLLKAKAASLLDLAPSSSQECIMDQNALEDLRCSITGVAFDHSDQVVLGFGICVELRPKDGSIASISTDLMPISFAVFQKGQIRKSALGMKITHFFPFAINDYHWKKARPVLSDCVDSILQGSQECNHSSSTPEDRLLFVVGELWKSMAVLMMKGDTHASEKVLKGFCALHHILLFATEEVDPLGDSFCLTGGAVSGERNVLMSTDKKPVLGCRDPELLESEWTVVVRRTKKSKPINKSETSCLLLKLAQKRVDRFVKQPSCRHKTQCPDFGRFLPLILFSDLAWDGIRKPLVQELLTRNARWITKEHRSLKYIKPCEFQRLSSRLELSWNASQTGMKLTAFQIYFALNVVEWAQSAIPKEMLQAYYQNVSSTNKKEKKSMDRIIVRAMYSRLGGRPTQEMMVTFQRKAKSIEAMTSYEEFFRTIGMPLDPLEIQVMLCNAMRLSERFHYHF